MNKVYCSKCEAANSDDATHCTMCGHSLASPTPAAPRTLIDPGPSDRVKRIQEQRDTQHRLETRLAEIRREIFSGQHDPSVPVDTIPCPKCERRIIPQWTYTGRKYLLIVEHFGIEGHGRSRFCPLCGVDIDQYIQDLVRQVEALKRKVPFADLKPRDKAARVTSWILIAIIIVLILVLIIAIARPEKLGWPRSFGAGGVDEMCSATC